VYILKYLQCIYVPVYTPDRLNKFSKIVTGVFVQSATPNFTQSLAF